MSQDRGATVRRLGVAVELPEPYAATLAEVRRATGDRLADQMPPHVTLVPPVTVRGSLAEVDAVLADAAGRAAPFEVHLRGTGSFRPVSEVVFVTVATGIGGFEQLAESLRVPPLDPPRAFPYHPHVTVAQEVNGSALDRVFDDLASFEARFTVASFRLYEFDAARLRWDAVADHPLGG